MPEKQLLTRNLLRKKASAQEEEDQVPRRPMERAVETPGLTAFEEPLSLGLLQDQVGNLAFQELLAQGQTSPLVEAGPEALAQLGPEALAAQRQSQPDPAAALETAAAQQPLEVGQVTLAKPEIEYDEIKADSLEEATASIKKPAEWFDYEYEYELKSDQDTIVEAEVQLKLKIHLPHWAGSGWEQATPAEQAEWHRRLKSFGVYDEKEETMTELPGNILLGPAWADAPDALKVDWTAQLQEQQQAEEGHLDRARRRARVLQQRLLHQPTQAAQAIYDQFRQDLAAEEEVYDHQRQFGQEEDVSLGKNVLIQ